MDIKGWKGRVAKTSPYRKLFNTLEFMGYVPGLTMQPIPYDTRYTFL